MGVQDTGLAAGETCAGPGSPPAGQVTGLIEEALLGGPRRYTRIEAARAAGVSLERSQRIWLALGFADVDDDARVFTDGDIEALRAWDSLISSGKIQAADEVPHVRAIGQTMSRLADWQGREMMTRWAAAAGRILAAPPGELSTETIVVGFADIVGYASTVRHSDIDELAVLLESFEENAAEAIVTNHGRVVKSLGDEVLFAAGTARDAAAIAARLSDPARAASQLPQLRVGMALGRVLTRFGDVYGPAVNLASRLTSLARPGTVLVDRELAEALRDDDDYVLRPRRPVTVRGYRHLRSWSLRPRKS